MSVNTPRPALRCPSGPDGRNFRPIEGCWGQSLTVAGRPAALSRKRWSRLCRIDNRTQAVARPVNDKERELLCPYPLNFCDLNLRSRSNKIFPNFAVPFKFPRPQSLFYELFLLISFYVSGDPVSGFYGVKIFIFPSPYSYPSPYIVHCPCRGNAWPF